MNQTSHRVLPLLFALAAAACTSFEGDPGQPVLLPPLPSDAAAPVADGVAAKPDIGAPSPDVAAPELDAVSVAKDVPIDVPILKPDSSGVCTLAQAAVCDDNNNCTNDKCNAATGACSYVLLDESTDASACTDGNACTLNDNCHNGKCVGIPTGCDDGNPCTSDGCVANSGCYTKPISNVGCDDGDECTSKDHCAAGKCIGTATYCNDGNPCTIDSCSGTNCVFTDSCNDGIGCTADACDAILGCTHADTCMGAFQCDPVSGKCVVAAGGCSGAISAKYLAQTKSAPKALASFQDAELTCTLKKGCLAKSTDDAKAACVAGCLAQETPLDATCGACYGAYNLCWAKQCLAQCAADPNSSPCAACVATNCDNALNFCAGTSSACQIPNSWGPNVQVISKLALADVGVGCDLNGDGKPDNAMGKFTSLYKDENKSLQDAISQGKLLTVWNAPQYTTGGGAFSIERLDAVLNPGDASCDVSAGGKPCNLLVKAASYDASSVGGVCAAKSQLQPASAPGGALKAAGGGGSIPISLLGMMDMQVNAAIDSWTGKVSGAGQWQATTGGLHCGAVTKTAMFNAIDTIPPSVLAQIGDAATVKSLIIGILKPDLDLDGDGIKESISFAMTFETVPVIVSGISP